MLPNEEDPDSHNDILDTILSVNRFNHAELLDQYMMLLSGGTHSSITAMKSAVWFLAKPENAHIQDRLWDEMRSCLPPLAPGSSLSRDTLDRLPYLAAVRDEVLHLYSAFSTTDWMVLTPTEVCGVVLPRGVLISISPWAMHRSHHLWSSEAESFRPERWLGNEVKQSLPTEQGS